MCDQIQQIEKYLFLCVISFYMVKIIGCSTGEIEKLIYENVYPVKGTWFKDIPSGKYYFKSGNSLFLQRNDLFFSQWKINENFDYKLESIYKWTWDKQGVFYPVAPVHESDNTFGVDNCGKEAKVQESAAIPVTCISKCPNQIRFPSGGIWHFTNCKLLYDINETRFEHSSNGFYKKWNLTTKSQIYPDWWTWDILTGVWQPAINKRNAMYAALNNAHNTFWKQRNSRADPNNMNDGDKAHTTNDSLRSSSYSGNHSRNYHMLLPKNYSPKTDCVSTNN